MATVHRATDLRQERRVAVKLLHPDVGRDPDLAQRFRREALAATVLRHPNIVACLDTGTDGDQPYLVMEYIDGEDLAARLRRGGRLGPWPAARIGRDVARALGVAHVRGIVHRDVKPGNILLAADGRAMVTDFGIARLAADAEASMPGTTLGSVQYFSPEQARGRTTTPASDVYGLGLVLYECLTGQRPWAGADNDALALVRVGATAPSPRAAVPEVPDRLDAIVRRAMAAEPEDRYANGAQLAAALDPIVDAGEIAPAIAPSARSAVSRGPGRRAVARRRTPALGVAGLATAGLVIGALLVAALPGDGGTGFRGDAGPSGRDGPTAAPPGDASPSATIRPATPTPTPDPTATAPPAPTATVAPPPTGTPLAPTGDVSDLCQVFFGLPCGLDPGRYAPSRFAPPFDVRLGTGWSAAQHAADFVTLTRDEGRWMFAAAIRGFDPDDDGRLATDARDLIESFIAADGVGSTRPATVTIGGRTGLSIDASTVDPVRVAIFRTTGGTYRLEPGRTTRLVAMDVDDAVVLLVIEPDERSDLRALLDTADVAAGTIRWR